jgi:hypothetical protein
MADASTDDPQLRALEAERALWRREWSVGRATVRRGGLVLASLPFGFAITVPLALAVDSTLPMFAGLAYVIGGFCTGFAQITVGVTRARRSRRQLRALAPARLLPRARVVRRG